MSHLWKKKFVQSAVSRELDAIDSNRWNWYLPSGLYPLSQWFPRLHVGITVPNKRNGQIVHGIITVFRCYISLPRLSREEEMIKIVDIDVEESGRGVRRQKGSPKIVRYMAAILG